MNENCGNCKFGANFSKDNDVGCCRRYPPGILYQPMPAVDLAGQKSINWSQQASAYPMAARGAWCGEYQPLLAIAKFDS